jgi:predicted NBD/HSP70 family sugar kinase
VPEEVFRHQVQRLFFRIMEAEGWADVPWEVVNDGEVTALAGALSLRADSILGISMGTSLAAGYVDPQGNIRPWLNELAFAPVDYRDDAPADEWSGDLGCGVQYFSQQAVARLAPAASLPLGDSVPLPERLVAVQEHMAAGDGRAARIYATIGTCFGYAIAHYAEFYSLRHLLVLGRVTSGEGGEILLREARSLLDQVFPELSSRVTLRTPDEKEKRHGQAIAAASLPALRPGAVPRR